MRKIFILIVFCLLLCSCNKNKETDLKKDNFNEMKEIMNNSAYVIIDVRTKEEYNTEHIVDAINIPYDEISENIDIDKNKTIFVYCKSGNRSKIAFNSLKKLGYVVYDLGSYSNIDLKKENLTNN